MNNLRISSRERNVHSRIQGVQIYQILKIMRISNCGAYESNFSIKIVHYANDEKETDAFIAESRRRILENGYLYIKKLNLAMLLCLHNEIQYNKYSSARDIPMEL